VCVCVFELCLRAGVCVCVCVCVFACVYVRARVRARACMCMHVLVSIFHRCTSLLTFQIIPVPLFDLFAPHIHTLPYFF